MLNVIKTGSKIQDTDFDGIFPDWVKTYSDMHWTPLTIAWRASLLLVSNPDTRVLDVGSGAGKFCLVGSAITKGTFIGIERRRPLVDVARSIVKHFELDRVSFICGNAMDIDWREFNAFYLYNPFAEHLSINAEDRIEADYGDDSILWSDEIYSQYRDETFSRLSGLKKGTRVATLNGYGKKMPSGYSLIYRGGDLSRPLQVWKKVR